jgi:plastocyanin
VFRSLPVRVVLALAACLLAVPASASALPGARISAKPGKLIKRVDYPGVQHLHYEYGPIDITPGQNNIEAFPNRLKPTVPGYITRFEPNLVYSGSKKVPRVDVIHLHHGVWLARGYPTFAAGEEKTTMQLPRGYGYRYDPRDRWIMNYMIHNLLPTPTRVSLTYEIDFIPASAPAAQSITEAKPLWMDVSGLKAYPVFDVIKGQGRNGKFTFPDQARPAQRDDIGAAREHTASRDMTLLATAGHLHPGGLHTDLKATRGQRTRKLFRSEAKYFEPAGAVSWDVSMTATEAAWKVAVKEGDRLNVSATYDSSRASWYESMGIMVVWFAEGIRPGAKDPFRKEIDWRGRLTHGHLPENNVHGGRPRPTLPDPRDLPSGPFAANLQIEDFVYGAGDFSLGGKGRRPPLVRAGESITFENLDATTQISARDSAYHTITSCKAPCTGTTGIAYPLADAKVQFDSGELGFGPAGFTPAAQRNTWQTPKRLKSGTYTYFCRIHPFMRGSFRVVGKR